MDSFGDRLSRRVRELDAPCVVGLDPRVAQLPDFARTETGNGLACDAAAVLAWNQAVIEAVAPLVPMVKPQSAFYEALGPHGFQVLRETVQLAREAGLLVLLDAKRSDIGSTAEAYARTAFDEDFLGADAMTVLHYFGEEGLAPFLRYATEEGKGLFVVVHSSNQSAGPVQDVELAGGGRYYELVARQVTSWGANCIGPESGYSSVGAVVGATYPEQLREVREAYPALPLLIPGYGHQGGTAADIAPALSGKPGGAVVAASRSICGLDERETGLGRDELVKLVAERTLRMVSEVRNA